MRAENGQDEQAARRVTRGNVTFFKSYLRADFHPSAKRSSSNLSLWSQVFALLASDTMYLRNAVFSKRQLSLTLCSLHYLTYFCCARHKRSPKCCSQQTGLRARTHRHQRTSQGVSSCCSGAREERTLRQWQSLSRNPPVRVHAPGPMSPTRRQRPWLMLFLCLPSRH